MLNRRLHRIIVSATIGIVLCSVVGAWLLFSRTSLFVAFICFLIVVALAITLVREMEKTDRQLEKFFSAIRHRDFNIHFTDAENEDRFIRNLFREMNQIMAQFESNEIELEERRLYYESILRVLTHEIRNSITPIASLSADLIKYADEYGRAGMLDGMQTINEQAQQLNTFLNAYHRLTHLPDPMKARVDARDLFDKLEQLLRSEVGSDRIRYDASPEGVEMLIDQNLVTLALINLIRNALQATEDNREARIRVEAGKIGDFLFIQVIDNGKGIAVERLEDIFIPFYSTKKEGSGIGLPLSRRIMQLHGGELTVNSNPGGETVFRMVFPDC